MKQKILFMLAARRVLWAAALVLPAFGASAGVVFTNLYSFQGGDFPLRRKSLCQPGAGHRR